MEVYFQLDKAFIQLMSCTSTAFHRTHFEIITARQFQLAPNFEDCIPRANFDTFLWALARKPKL